VKRLLLAICLCTLAFSSSALAANEPPPWFTPLFNGKDLTGWKHDAEVEKHWTAVDGVLTYDGKGSNLRTAKKYSNFILTLRWRVEEDVDSGIYLRGKPQVNILGTRSGELHEDGVMVKKSAVRPIGEWNHFVIIMRGRKVTVILNGVQVVDRATMNSIGGMPPEGPIELQHHGSSLWFKDIYIRELP